MGDIRNIRPSGTAPDKICKVINGKLTEIKKAYRCINGKFVVVWDIGELPSNCFITTWQITANEELVFPIVESTGNAGIIDWGDGTSESYNSSEKYSHTYSSDGIYTITVRCDITEIKSAAFRGQIKLKSIVKIPENITTIKDFVFGGCTNLEYATIPETTNRIDGYAFSDCENLKSINLPNSLKYIETGAFSDCYLLEIKKIPDSLYRIGQYAFEHCESLNISEIPKSVKYLSSTYDDGSYICGAFQYCKSIKNMDFYAYPNRMVTGCFYECTGLETVNIMSQGMTVIGKSSFYNCISLRRAYICNSVNDIEEKAFYGCESLNDIRLGESVKYLRANCFENCKSLEEITLPASVVVVYDYCFKNCSNLKTINIMNIGSVYTFTFMPGALYNTQVRTINFAGTYREWEYATTLRNGWNENCCDLKVHCTNMDIFYQSGSNSPILPGNPSYPLF